MTRRVLPGTLPLLLLDRDGSLILDEGYLKDPRKVFLYADVIRGLKRLVAAGFPMVLISNQSGIGRRLITRLDARRVQSRFETLLAARGVRLLGSYWCPHHPKVRCPCRKPKLGLVRKAAKELGRSWRGSISIGDKWSDVQLGQRTGGKGVLLLTGVGREALKKNPFRVKPDFVAKNFKTAADWLIRSAKRSQ